MVVVVVVAGYCPNGKKKEICVRIRIWCLRAIVCAFVRVEKLLSWTQEKTNARETNGTNKQRKKKNEMMKKTYTYTEHTKNYENERKAN